MNVLAIRPSTLSFFAPLYKNYKYLKTWQKSYNLCLEISSIAEKLPKEDSYCLSSQIIRSSMSISFDMADGYGRKTTLYYNRVPYIVYGAVR